ncbi:hypothetical protein EDF27_2789 [Curtobacterium sp. PhB136]|nr:hypothetical protein EDF27_2789 [Curtobacterium sp. PhB136]
MTGQPVELMRPTIIPWAGIIGDRETDCRIERPIARGPGIATWLVTYATSSATFASVATNFSLAPACANDCPAGCTVRSTR